MALIKPSSRGSNQTKNYQGICEIAVIGYTDKRHSVDLADVYIEVEVKEQGSDDKQSIKLDG